jgi:hypothetical protein
VNAKEIKEEMQYTFMQKRIRKECPNKTRLKAIK